MLPESDSVVVTPSVSWLWYAVTFKSLVFLIGVVSVLIHPLSTKAFLAVPRFVVNFRYLSFKKKGQRIF